MEDTMTQTNQDLFPVGPTPDTTKPLNAATDYLHSHDAGEIADDARGKVQQVAGDVQEKAAQLGTQATDQINSAMTSAGHELHTLAQTVREGAPDAKVRDLADSTAGALERSGTYLENANLETVRSDLETMIRDHPVESLLVGVGVGFLLARSMRR
jgi:ElaB/YqjD/DUF883 family membrane-anchored ribosome-binding protein